MKLFAACGKQRPAHQVENESVEPIDRFCGSGTHDAPRSINIMGNLSRSVRLVPYVILAGFRRNFTWMSGDKPAIVLNYPQQLDSRPGRPSLLRQIVATERSRDALWGDRQGSNSDRAPCQNVEQTRGQ